MADGTERNELEKSMTVFEIVDKVFIEHDRKANQQQARCLLDYLAGMRTKTVVASDGLTPVVIIQLGRLASGKAGN